MTRFSIILPCYNGEATIEATLASLQAQSCADWEALCIDDGSTDATPAILAAAAARDPRIRVMGHPGKGPSAARNHAAFDHARGEVLAFCDADDLWQPTKLAELEQAFADPAIAGAYGQIGFFAQTPLDARTFSTVPEGALSLELLLGENPVCTMSNLAIRRQVFRASGGFDAGMVHNEDLEFLIRLVGEGYPILGIDSLQTWYRTSVGGLSTDLAAMAAGRRQALATAQRYGAQPSARQEAIYLRYLARRALRVEHGGAAAARFALAGLWRSPAGFLSDPRRGGLTLIAALLAPLLPPATRRSLFYR